MRKPFFGHQFLKLPKRYSRTMVSLKCVNPRCIKAVSWKGGACSSCRKEGVVEHPSVAGKREKDYQRSHDKRAEGDVTTLIKNIVSTMKRNSKKRKHPFSEVQVYSALVEVFEKEKSNLEAYGENGEDAKAYAALCGCATGSGNQCQELVTINSNSPNIISIDRQGQEEKKSGYCANNGEGLVIVCAAHNYQVGHHEDAVPVKKKSHTRRTHMTQTVDSMVKKTRVSFSQHHMNTYENNPNPSPSSFLMS